MQVARFFSFPLSDVAKHVLWCLHQQESSLFIGHLGRVCTIWRNTFQQGETWEILVSQSYQNVGDPAAKEPDDGHANLASTLAALKLSPDVDGWKRIYFRLHSSPRFCPKTRNLYHITNFGFSCYRYWLLHRGYLSCSLIDTPLTPAYPFMELLSDGFCLATKTVREEFLCSRSGMLGRDPRYAGDTRAGTSLSYGGSQIYMALVHKQIPNFEGMRETKGSIGIYVNFSTETLTIFAGGRCSEQIDISTMIVSDTVWPFVMLSEMHDAWVIRKLKAIPPELASLKPTNEKYVISVSEAETDAELSDKLDRQSGPAKKLADMHAGITTPGTKIIPNKVHHPGAMCKECGVEGGHMTTCKHYKRK